MLSNYTLYCITDVEDPEDIEKFLREGVMMRGLDHPNVLALLGVCIDADMEQKKTSPLIVLPFMENGDLRTFLRDGNNVSVFLILSEFFSLPMWRYAFVLVCYSVYPVLYMACSCLGVLN